MGGVRRIVVGLDGSSAAGAAVEWACDEATVHGADLCLVHAVDRDGDWSEAQGLLDLAIAECRARTEVVVSGLLVEGPAGPALIELSRDADLIAIGSRGRSGFKTALFGSVALTVAEHADCPVAVTHPRLRTTGPG
jgi:nucleotide-binding universal stress UspA family protein